jgi:peptidyl-prolyl cis-trans isomerase C
MRQRSWRIAIHIGLLLMLVAAWPEPTAAQAPSKSGRSVVARVDAKALTQEDLERIYKFRNVPQEMQAKLRPDFIELLIDTELMQQFLKAEKIPVAAEELNEKVKQIKELLAKSEVGGLNLKKFGLTEQTLRDELSLPLKWQIYVNKNITELQIEKYFEAHRSHFDGTELRVSQIFLAVEDMSEPPQVAAGLARLAKIRKEIVDGLSFADAAKKYSDSPTGVKGGDVGRFQFQGPLSPQLKKMAFSLSKGEISQPFAGAKGVHLCVVTERKDGDLTLEDVRSHVLETLRDELWAKKIKELKAKAQIERVK